LEEVSILGSVSIGLKRILVLLLLLLVTAGVSSAGVPGPGINLDVKQFTLENGMLFLVVERAATPQVACRVAIRAGSAFENAGSTGIAHMLEHMMFKGTMNFGSLDPEKDGILQGRIEEAFQAVLKEQGKRSPDREKVAAKLDEMNRLRNEVQEIFVPHAFSAQLGRNGAVGVNAFTSKDQTQYMTSVPSDMLEQWFSIISEQLFEPAWREFYVEKEVVQREWAYRYVNNPGGAAWLDLGATAYTAHPYRNPVIGWKSDMERFNTRDAMAYHREYYRPANAVCVLVGDVTPERAKKLANVYFSRYPAGKRAAETVTAEPPQRGARQSVRFLPGARTPLLRVGFHGARMGTDDFYALDALSMLMSHGRGARLRQKIVDEGKAIDAWAANPDNRFGGMIVLGGTPVEPEEIKAGGLSEEDTRNAYLKACENLEELLLGELEKLKTSLVSEDELIRIKRLNQHDFLRSLRSNEALAGTLATLEVQTGWKYLTGYLERIEQITPEDIRRVARKYIRAKNRTSVYVIPGGEPDRPPQPYAEMRSVSGSAVRNAVAPDTLENRSIYPTPIGWKHPLSFKRHPEKIVYPRPEKESIEGATLFHLKDDELPLIDMKLLVKAGAVDMGDETAGLGSLFELCLIRGGAGGYGPRELAAELDRHAVRLSVSVGQEETVIGLSVMKSDWEKGLELLEKVLARPLFDTTVLEVSKQEAMVDLQRQGGDALTVARREAMIWHFKDHPYGRDPLKGLQRIPRITRKDLEGFLKTYFVPSNMVVAVSGDIDKRSAMDGLSRLLKALPDQDAPSRKLAIPKKTPPVLALVHKPGQVQSQVVLLLPSVRRSNEAFWKLSLLINIFGGSDSMLYTRLRDELGLVYAAWFYQAYKWEAGMLTGYIGCQGVRTGEAIEETVNVMSELRKALPPSELRQKRLDVLNSFVFNVDTPIDLVTAYGRYHMRGEPLDTLERIQDAYISVSQSDLEELAGQFLDPKKLQIFVVADKETRMKGSRESLEADLKGVAEKIGVPYREMKLR